MYALFYGALIIFWIFDIINLPSMKMFDTVYPINGLAWWLIWMLLPTPSNSKENSND